MIVNYRSKICKGNTIANKRLVYQGLAGMLFTLQYYSFCTITWIEYVVIALNCQNRLQQWRCNKRLKLVTLTYLSTHSVNYEIMYLHVYLLNPCNNDWNEKIHISHKRLKYIQNYSNYFILYLLTKNPPKKPKVKKLVRPIPTSKCLELLHQCVGVFTILQYYMHST